MVAKRFCDSLQTNEAHHLQLGVHVDEKIEAEPQRRKQDRPLRAMFLLEPQPLQALDQQVYGREPEGHRGSVPRCTRPSQRSSCAALRNRALRCGKPTAWAHR